MIKSLKFGVIIRYVFLMLVFLFSVGPIVLLFSTSLKSTNDFMLNPFGPPSKLIFENIPKAWVAGGYAIAYRNSIVVGLSTILIVTVFGGACAFALAKMKFKGNSAVMTYIILTMSVPIGMCLVPLFFMWQKLHLMGSLLGMVIIYSGIYLPFNTIFLRTFFIGIPDAILESGRMDGCSDLQNFFLIVLPIAKPAFLTVSLLVLLNTWNEFFFANAFLNVDKWRTVATRYLTFTGSFTSDWTMICAAGAVALLPIMIFYLLFQRNFIEGLTAGSVKG